MNLRTLTRCIKEEGGSANTNIVIADNLDPDRKVTANYGCYYNKEKDEFQLVVTKGERKSDE